MINWQICVANAWHQKILICLGFSSNGSKSFSKKVFLPKTHSSWLYTRSVAAFSLHKKHSNILLRKYAKQGSFKGKDDIWVLTFWFRNQCRFVIATSIQSFTLSYFQETFLLHQTNPVLAVRSSMSFISCLFSTKWVNNSENMWSNFKSVTFICKMRKINHF